MVKNAKIRLLEVSGMRTWLLFSLLKIFNIFFYSRPDI